MDGRTARALHQRLESLADAGVTSLPRPGRGGPAPVPTAAPSPIAVPSPAVAPVRPADDAVVAGAADRVRELAVLRQQVIDCTRCTELAAARTQTVFGVGDPAARLCFFGEAPGADEDATGEPFVGRAGQLLTKIIEACRLTREQVYILNVLKCRPPGNRTPDPAEVANCRPFFVRQFEVIAPEFICCLGATAAHALLGTAEPIGRLRRRWFTHGAAQVICTYHPSYLLRNPAAKKDVWEDMKMLMERMGVVL
ncbi:MAG: uracil-DNA glycosylase family protein [Planctomycetaceae bacterium]